MRFILYRPRRLGKHITCYTLRHGFATYWLNIVVLGLIRDLLNKARIICQAQGFPGYVPEIPGQARYYGGVVNPHFSQGRDNLATL